jgi:hypothetical protein
MLLQLFSMFFKIIFLNEYEMNSLNANAPTKENLSECLLEVKTHVFANTYQSPFV